MDYETVKAEAFGASLKGLGVNILVRDVLATVRFLTDVFGMKTYQTSKEFAIMEYAGTVFQLHGDATYRSHPLPSLLPEAGARGGGIELRLYETDPDEAVVRVKSHDHNTTILQSPTDKPHGLRECVILCENGYAWVPSIPLKTD